MQVLTITPFNHQIYFAEDISPYIPDEFLGAKRLPADRGNISSPSRISCDISKLEGFHYEGIAMLLIYPPVAKPSEPPAGIAKLAGTLARHGVSCQLLDANIEGLMYMLRKPQTAASDNWSRRAIRHRFDNLAALKDMNIYSSPDRYARAVRDLQRALAIAVHGREVTLGLADYRHQRLSPLRSADLFEAAQHPEQNPFYPYFQKRIPEVMKGMNTPVVGISLNYLNQALCAFALIGYIRQEFPRCKVIMGGGLVTSWMQRPGWQNPFSGFINHLVAGPGEQPLLELLGIGDIREDQSTPDYGTLPLADYIAPGFILPYSASSGCYWSKCAFCPERAEDSPYRPLPDKLIIADLHSLAVETKPILIHFLDNAISPKLLRALADHPPGVPWYGFARFGRELTNGDFCQALKRSGCVMLKLGLESGDQRVLDAMGKGIDLEMASQVLQNLKEAGIAVYLYLLFGTPAETEEEARRTLAFVVRHIKAISFLNIAIFNMPVCGPEDREYETRRFYDGDLSLYTGFRHPCGWDRRQVRRFLDQEFKQHPAVASLLKNNPPIFTSNHAAFRYMQ